MNHALSTTVAGGVEIFMSTLSATARLQRGTLGDLAVMWVAFFAAFAYLDVPLRNAPLFATTLVLQAALGAFGITRLLDGLQPSLLLLCGPGLILGGALSFALFQIVGRGVVGIIATTGAGLVAAFVVSQQVKSSGESPRMWILTQILGLAGLALVVEFSEMLPIAVAFFTLAHVLDPSRPKPVLLQIALISVTACVIVFTFSIRQNYWWLASDDYQFFEVISRHITQSGPTADWGVTNFFRYHWLSYGWSGLLDQLGGRPAPFVTLAQVMPFIYSASLASSLMLISERAQRRIPTFSGFLPVWFVVTLVDIDWAGTSTSGVYAALAALVFVFRFLDDGQRVQLRQLLLLGFVTLIVTLTKMPSIFSVLALLLGSLGIKVASRFPQVCIRAMFLVFGGLATSSVIMLLVWLSGPYFGWHLDLTSVNYGLGQISESGRIFSTITLVLLRLPLWILVVSLAVRNWNEAGLTANRRLSESLPAVTPLLLGLLLELGVFGHSNTFLYLAGPMYFLASLSIIAHFDVLRAKSQINSRNRYLTLFVAMLFAFEALWTERASEGFWDLVDRTVTFLPDFQISLLRFATADNHIWPTVIILVIATGLVVARKTFPTSQVLLLSVPLLTFGNSFWTSVSDYATKISPDFISTYLGTQDSQAIAARLTQVSLESDLVATNFLFNTNGEVLSDFSLAAWSGREFLILGPRFLGELSGRKAEAIEYSMQFAETPSIDTCQALEEAGVRWFVVDLRLTNTRNWSVCANLDLSVGNLVLLSMHFPRSA